MLNRFLFIYIYIYLLHCSANNKYIRWGCIRFVSYRLQSQHQKNQTMMMNQMYHVDEKKNNTGQFRKNRTLFCKYFIRFHPAFIFVRTNTHSPQYTDSQRHVWHKMRTKVSKREKKRSILSDQSFRSGYFQWPSTTALNQFTITCVSIYMYVRSSNRPPVTNSFAQYRQIKLK